MAQATAPILDSTFSDMPRERRDFRYERNSGYAPARLESPSLAHLRRGGPARECPLLAEEQTCGRPTEN
jgi:hypothetical protein